MNGTLYGVSVGPGDPELMTLKAVRILSNCPVIAAPRTGGSAMLALEIATGALNFADKTVLPLDFTMSPDANVRAENHRALFAALRTHLDAGADVAVLNLGDASIYGTWSYLETLAREADYKTVTIPGVPSFCAAAAALGESLTEISTPLHILPGAWCDPDEILALSGTKVILKSARALSALKAALHERGYSSKTALVENCGLPGERIFPTLDEAEGNEGYFSIFLIRP